MSLKTLRRRLRLGWEDHRYARRAQAKGLQYDPAAVAGRIRHPQAVARLKTALAEGNLRIFAAVRHHNWEGHNLIPALSSLGEVIHYDWGADGMAPDLRWSRADKQEMNLRLLARFERAQQSGPVHLFFSYVTGRQVFPQTIATIRESGAITLNISLDDRAKFKGRRKHGAWTGLSTICREFDLSGTSTPGALIKYLVEGANPVFMPEGANPQVYRPHDLPFEYDVSFVGQCYGVRPRMVAALARRGIRVATFGTGWPKGPLPVEEMVQIYSKSRINLGFGGVGDGDHFVCLKGRDMEIPMAGGLYLTQYNPELTMVYSLGDEIVCYHDIDDLADQIQSLLNDPERAAQIRAAGHLRARADHSWEDRFRHMLGLLTDTESGTMYPA